MSSLSVVPSAHCPPPPPAEPQRLAGQSRVKRASRSTFLDHHTDHSSRHEQRMKRNSVKKKLTLGGGGDGKGEEGKKRLKREHAAGGWGLGAKAANNGWLLSDTGYQFFSPNLEPARCLAHRLLSPSGICIVARRRRRWRSQQPHRLQPCAVLRKKIDRARL